MDNISCNSFTAILYFVCMAAKCSTSTDTHHMFSVVFTVHHTHQISCHFVSAPEYRDFVLAWYVVIGLINVHEIKCICT